MGTISNKNMNFKDFFNNIFKKSEKIYDYNFFKNLPVKDYPKYIKIIYEEKTGKKLNLKKPLTFSEKIQWLKLYDNLPIKTELSDKLKVRDWVKEKTDKLHFAEIYGVWNSFDEINFDSLPNAFALKTNHGSSMNIIVLDKSEIPLSSKPKLKNTFDNWMNSNFAYSYGFELQYKNIVPKIYAEEILSESNEVFISEYCVICMNGKAKLIEKYTVFHTKVSTRAIFNTEWEQLPYTHTNEMHTEKTDKPKNLKEIIEISELLANEFKLVRVDFVDRGGMLYFREMTFTPCSGHMTFNPPEYDQILGDMLDLEIKGNEKIIL